ncbi:uncharacterized protein JCM6883_004255 [Sporobolomyces salmoneus]|uniref:uncharacterized protein n=1 Tax=Sporobolomyces salmoneus TaxID=183962 RepID=UPI003176780F
MSFFFKFLTGAVIGGTATIYYRDQIQSTSTKLSSDLNTLSRQIVQGREVPHSPVQTSNGVAMIPRRLPLTEEIKARWNSQLSNGFESIRTTNWSSVASKSWNGLKGLAGQAKEQVVDPAKEQLESVNGREGVVRGNERMVDRIDGKL